MKKSIVALTIFLSVIILGTGGFFLYMKLSKHGTRDTFSLVPSDAIYILETKNVTDGWNAISQSKIWAHLLNNEYFSDINENVAQLDVLLKRNQAIDVILRERRMMVSAHLISGRDYDFLFIVDLGAQEKLSFLTTFLDYIQGYKVEKKEYDKVPVYVLINKLSGDKIFLSLTDNLLVVTFNEKLIVKSLEQRKTDFWAQNQNFQLVASDVRDNKLFNVYFNYKLFDKYLKIYLEDSDELSKALSDALCYSGFQINLENERLTLDGYTTTDSVSSYIKAMQEVEPGKLSAFNVIPENSALYLSLAFDNYSDFYNQLIAQFAVKNGNKLESYDANIKKAEKFLKVNLAEDFFNWIGNEISFVKLPPSGATRLEDVVVCMQAEKIELAKAGLTHLTNQVRKRTPVKFDAVDYKGFEINFLSIKGFFRMFFGKLFGKLDKPYFTYIDDFVVFSNSMDALKQVIDNYKEGKTLSKNEKFMNFMNDFPSKCNISVFVQMPKIYANLYQYSTSEKQESIRKNKDIILSFCRLGFQMKSESKRFVTKLVADHEEMDALSAELQLIEQEARDGLMNVEIDSLSFKVILGEKELAKDGPFKILYEDGKLKAEGSVKNKQVEGLCRSYFPSGRIRNSVFYTEGKVNGVVEFFYEDEKSTKRVEAMFATDRLIGVYREYFDNGTRKALLNYDEGLLNGSAEYYYKSGKVKVQGEFKDGIKSGKWSVFSEDGEVIEKEKWRKGNLKT
jgi:hypothetical protein